MQTIGGNLCIDTPYWTQIECHIGKKGPPCKKVNFIEWIGHTLSQSCPDYVAGCDNI